MDMTDLRGAAGLARQLSGSAPDAVLGRLPPVQADPRLITAAEGRSAYRRARTTHPRWLVDLLDLDSACRPDP